MGKYNGKEFIRTTMKSTTFRYTEPFSNHFLYRHTVGDHNKLQHSSPSIEETWIMQRCLNQVFAYLLATSEVNTFLAQRYFLCNEDEVPEYAVFRRHLAEQLINN